MINDRRHRLVSCIVLSILLPFFLIQPDILAGKPGQNKEIPAAVKSKEITLLKKKLDRVRGKKRIEILTRLVCLSWRNQPHQAVIWGEEAIALARSIEDRFGLGLALYRTAFSRFMLGDRQKTLEYRTEALEIFRRLKNSKFIGLTLAAIGDFYRQRRFFNMALQYFLDALKIYKEISYPKGIASISWHLGNLYLNKQDPSTALRYFQEALNLMEKTREKTGEKNGYVLYLQSVALAYHKLADYPKALEFFRASLAEAENSGDRSMISANLDNIAMTLISLKKPDEALTFLLRSKKILDVINDEDGLPFNLLYTGNAYMLKNEYNTALLYFRNALNTAVKAGDKVALEGIYQGFADLYQEIGDCLRVLQYSRLQWNIKRELYNAEHDRQFEELRAQFQADQQKKQIQLLEKENKIRRMTANVFILGFLLVSLILAFLFKRYLYLFTFWKKQKYVGQYRLLDSIGHGGMGTVYKAHRIRNKDELAAVKVLRDELAEDPVNRKRFKREGTIIDELEHPNIVHVFERGNYKGKWYIAMELLSGTTLEKEILERGPIPITNALPIMIQITRALVFVHSRDVVHRDLKPANIMLLNSTELPVTVKLLDFGLALEKSHSRLTDSGILVGTIQYTAPEQIIENQYTAAGDVYALGVIFYEILTGIPAFPGKNITTIVEKILDAAPLEPRNLLPGIPGGLNRLILRMLEKEPGKRPAAVHILEILESGRDF